MRRALLASALAILLPAVAPFTVRCAHAQTNPGFYAGSTISASGIDTAFARKVDTLGGVLTGATIDATTTINGNTASTLVTQSQMQAAIQAAIASIGTGAGTGTGTTSPGLPTAASPNWIWRAGMTAGFDMERGTAITPSLWQAALSSATAAGVTHVGMTIDYMPDADFAGTGQNPVQPFSDATIGNYFNTVQAFVAAGIRVRINFLDVCSTNAATTYRTLIRTHLQNCARLFATYNFPTNMVAVGCFSEMAGSSNTFWMPMVADYHVYMASLLPANTPISLGGANWNYFTQLTVASGFTIPAAILNQAIVETHFYDLISQLSDATNIANKLAAIEAETGCPCYVGESGLNNSGSGTNLYSDAGYTTGLQWYSTAFNRCGFLIWSISYSSGSGAFNNSATDGTFRPAMATAWPIYIAKMGGAISGPGMTATVPAIENISLATIAQANSGASVSVSVTLTNLAANYTPVLLYRLDGTNVSPSAQVVSGQTATGRTVTATFQGIADGVHSFVVTDSGNAAAGGTTSNSFRVGTQTLSITLDSTATASTTARLTSTGGLTTAYVSRWNGSSTTDYAHAVTMTNDANGNGTGSYPITWTKAGDYLQAWATSSGGAPKSQTQAYAPVTTGFTIAASPSTVRLATGTAGTTTLTVTGSASGSYSGTATLAVSGLPSGVSGVFSPATLTNGAGTSTLTLTGTNATAAATSPLTITASDGTLSPTASASLIIANAPTSLSLSMPNTTLYGSGTLPANITAGNGAGAAGSVVYYAVFSAGNVARNAYDSGHSVTLDANGAATINPMLIATGDYVELASTTGGGAPNANGPPVTVNPASFILTAPANASLVAGASSTINITLTPQGSYSGTDGFSVSGLPSGVSSSFNPTSVTNGNGAVVLTLTAAAGIAATTTPITVSASDGSIVQTAPISLTTTTAAATSATALNVFTPAATPASAAHLIVTGTYTGALASLDYYLGGTNGDAAWHTLAGSALTVNSGALTWSAALPTPTAGSYTVKVRDTTSNSVASSVSGNFLISSVWVNALPNSSGATPLWYSDPNDPACIVANQDGSLARFVNKLDAEYLTPVIATGGSAPNVLLPATSGLDGLHRTLQMNATTAASQSGGPNNYDVNTNWLTAGGYGAQGATASGATPTAATLIAALNTSNLSTESWCVVFTAYLDNTKNYGTGPIWGQLYSPGPLQYVQACRWNPPSSNKLAAQGSDASGGGFNAASTTAPASQWNVFTMLKTGTSVILRQNGVQIGTVTASDANAFTAKDFMLGGGFPPSSGNKPNQENGVPYSNFGALYIGAGVHALADAQSLETIAGSSIGKSL